MTTGSVVTQWVSSNLHVHGMKESTSDFYWVTLSIGNLKRASYSKCETVYLAIILYLWPKQVMSLQKLLGLLGNADPMSLRTISSSNYYVYKASEDVY